MSLIDRIADEARQTHATVAAAKAALRLALNDHPELAAPLGGARRTARLLAFHLRARQAERALGDPYLVVDRMFYVPVAALRRRTALPYGYDPMRRPGAVIAGDWDQRPETIADKPDSIEFREALRGGRPWTETAAFRRRMEPAEAETRTWRRRVFTAETQRAIHDWQTMYASMQMAGALSQRQLARRGGSAFQPLSTDDISIAIGRTGEMELLQGNHRVEAAIALGIEAVPAWVGVRHADWWALRREIVAYAAVHGGAAPEPLLHPDLQDVPFAWDCGARFDMVAAALPEGAGALVDAAPGWGYFLHRFESLGFACTGIASEAEDRPFIERLRVAGDKRFAVVDDAALGDRPTGPIAALLLLRDAGARLADEHGRTALAAILAKTQPRHVFVELGEAKPGVPADGRRQTTSDDVLRLCGAAMTRPRVRLLGRVGARAVYQVSVTGVTADDASAWEGATRSARDTRGKARTTSPRLRARD